MKFPQPEFRCDACGEDMMVGQKLDRAEVTIESLSGDPTEDITLPVNRFHYRCAACGAVLIIEEDEKLTKLRGTPPTPHRELRPLPEEGDQPL